MECATAECLKFMPVLHDWDEDGLVAWEGAEKRQEKQGDQVQNKVLWRRRPYHDLHLLKSDPSRD